MVIQSPEAPGKKLYMANTINLTKTSQGLDALKTTGNGFNAYAKLMNATTLNIMSEPTNYGLIYSGPSELIRDVSPTCR